MKNQSKFNSPFHVGGWIDVYKADESELEFARFVFYLKIRYKKLGEQEVC